MVRTPAVAGQFYPGSEKRLKNKIEESFKHRVGPGTVPRKEGNTRQLKGLVVPHAGYEYSGPVAAHSYKRLYEDGFPDTFVILGPNHQGYGGDVVLTDEEFLTPIGKVSVNKDIVNDLKSEGLEINQRAHTKEHSLEVQLPFLQYFSEDFDIVPLTFIKQDLETVKDIGRKLRKVLRGKDVVIIASTDFSHYVMKDVAEKKDKMAIEKIEENDPEGLYNVVQEENISMCGYGPVISMMIGSDGRKGELLKYATSGDIARMREVVGYGALAFL